MLSRSQSLFLTTAINGHNITLTGQGGSGKTFVLQKLVKELCSRGKNVAITCTTGIAATQYENGQTLHRWCGIGDGGIPKRELSVLLANDERYGKAKDRIISCDVLIVDECSMLSRKMFETVEFLCRSVRGTGRYFGGLQVILSGDFYQLPPVPDELYGETGEFCFQSNTFFNVIPHCVHLDTVFRQNDSNMISCINEIEKGTPSKQTLEFLKTLGRDIPFDEDTVYLFSTNLKVKLFNHDKLKSMPGNTKLYRAQDDGDAYYLKKFQAPPLLGLKVNCPVMLVVNLSETLVNGSRGIVKALNDNSITVHFTKPDMTVNISRHLFSKVDPTSRRMLSKRLQFPLVLSFGLTIHKAQGMTLQYVVVDCTDAYIPGQIGVALGRATSAEHLQVINFRPSMIKEHPGNVKMFYSFESKIVLQDHSCCKNEFISKTVEDDLFTPFEMDEIEDADFLLSNDDDDDDDDDDGDGGGIMQASTIDTENLDEILSKQKPAPIPDNLDPVKVLNTVYSEYQFTPMENQIKGIVDKILGTFQPFYTWLSSHYLKMNKISNDNFVDAEKAEPKNATKFCADINSFLKSDEYFSQCKYFFSTYEFESTKVSQFFCNSVSFYLQNFVLEQKAKLMAVIEVNERTIPTENFEEGKGNIRYIGGYCISKLRYGYQKKIQFALYDPKKEKKLDMCRAKDKLLSMLVISYSELSVTTDFSETLTSTSRKQNVRQGLTNITDSAYLFFQSLTNKIRQLETFSNLHTFGQYVVEMVRSHILDDRALFQQWMSMFNDRDSGKSEDEESEGELEIMVCYITELFNETVSKFINVSASHFRKDYLLHIKREKSKAHRKKVMEKKDKKSTKMVSFDDIQSDKSDGKVVTHFKLKSGVMDNDNYFHDRFYTKKNLQKLCEAYEIPVLSSHNKKYLNDQLVTVIKSTDFMLTPQVFHSVESQFEAQNTMSSVQTDPGIDADAVEGVDTSKKSKGKGKGKGKGKRSKSSSKGKAKKSKSDDVEVEDTACPICSKPYDDSPNWICCDSCDKWLHGQCVGINTEAQWEVVNNESVDFICPFCQ